MEDLEEHVIFEGNQLHQYLTDIGFKEFDVTQRAVSTNSILEKKQKYSDHGKAVDVASPSWIWVYGTKLLKSYNSYESGPLLEHVEIILKSGLMFEEDVNVLQSMISDGKGEQHEDISHTRSFWMNRLFTDALKYSVGSLSWCCYGIWGVAVLPMTATASVILFSLWGWKKSQQSKKRLHQQNTLCNTLKNLFFILKKSLKYIQENELILRGFLLAKTGSVVSRLENSKLPCMAKRWQSMPGLRKGIVYALLAAVDAFKRGTLELLLYCPLTGQLDNNGHYLACLDQETLGLPQFDHFECEEKITIQELKRLHHIYLLLQSEFLRRLGLSFITHLWKEDNITQIESVMKNVLHLTDVCSTIASNLTREYNVFYSYGVGDGAQKKRSLSISDHTSLVYADTYLAIHSAGLHLQTMLLRIRAIEQTLEAEIEESSDISKDLLSKMMDIMEELELFKSCCDECLSQVNKVHRTSQVIEIQPQTNSSKSPFKSLDLLPEPILVGYTDLDPKVEDEVYEAEIHHEDEYRDTDFEYFDYVKISRDDREREKQLSERMLIELKSVLVDRAQEWKEREAKVLESKQVRYETFHMKSGKIIKSDTPLRNCTQAQKELQVNSSQPDLSIEFPKSDSSIDISQVCNPIPKPRISLSSHSNLHNSQYELSLENTVSIEHNKSIDSNRDMGGIIRSVSSQSEDSLPPVNFGSLLSLDAVAKFRSNTNILGTETFFTLGDKSSSEESLCSP